MIIFFFPALTFAHRAPAAAAILALVTALILNFFLGEFLPAIFDGEPKILPSCFSSDSIFSFSSAALLSCCGDSAASKELMEKELQT
jgi:hypothetical protein